MADLLPSGYLATSGPRIVDAATDTPVRLVGVNWYGFDCNSMVVGGLDYQTVDAICRTIVGLGFNTIRLPFSVEVVLQNPAITAYLGKNPSLQGRTALQIMDAVISTAGSHGLKVILDSHRAEAGWSLQSNGLWYTDRYAEVDWLNAWEIVVRRYAGNRTVIGCDLHNELGSPPPNASAWPANGGALWGYGDEDGQLPRDWAAAAVRAGNSIHQINRDLLIFVEGVRYDPAGPAGNDNLYWPGGNLSGVGRAGGDRPGPVPVQLAVPNRLVYSVHDYGYSGLPWVQLDSTYEDCVQVWYPTWGYIVETGVAPVWIGEFGTANGYRPGDRTPPVYYTDPNPVNPQGAWFTHLVQYIAHLQSTYQGGNWCYWAINGTQSEAPHRNPSHPDWYGVLKPDWSDFASRPMMDKLRSIQ